MPLFFPLFLLLPVIELLVFFMVSAKIGVLASLLWLVAAVFFGIMVIKSVGTQSWKRVQHGEDALMMPDLFDALCRLLAGILLIFPGFVSDLFAMLFLLPAIRQTVFNLARDRNTPRMHTSHAPHNDAATPPPAAGPVIDGDFRRIDREEIDRK